MILSHKNSSEYSRILSFVADIVSEESILTWYKDTHSPRGWSFFVDQMKKFAEWHEQYDEISKKTCSLHSLFTVLGPEMHPMMEKSKIKLGQEYLIFWTPE